MSGGTGDGKEEMEITFWMGKLDVAASLVVVAKRVPGGACGDETSRYYDRAHPDLAIGALDRNISTC
jgi:hypothetical protein